MEDMNYTELDWRWAKILGVALSRLHRRQHLVFARHPG
jgi:hypothetical protein